MGVRAQGIKAEYEELDTVWFMSGSLFKNYPCVLLHRGCGHGPDLVLRAAHFTMEHAPFI